MDKPVQSEYSKFFTISDKDYANYYKSICNILPIRIKEMNMHDCKIVSIKTIDNDLIIDIDNSAGYTLATKVIYKNCMILMQECDLKNAWWIDNWVFIVQDYYIFGNTFDALDCSLTTNFFVKASDVEFVYQNL